MPPAPSWRLFRRTTDLPLDRFITAYCDEDLTALIREGKPPPDAIAEAWNDVRSEWEDKLQDSKSSDVTDTIKEINHYKTQYTSISSIVSVLNCMPVKIWIEHLQPDMDFWLGQPYPLETMNMEILSAQLAGAMGIATRFLTEALALEAQLPPEPKSEHGKKMSRENFAEIVVNLSKYNHYKISRRETTTDEFIIMIKDMNRGLDAAARVNNN